MTPRPESARGALFPLGLAPAATLRALNLKETALPARTRAAAPRRELFESVQLLGQTHGVRYHIGRRLLRHRSHLDRHPPVIPPGPQRPGQPGVIYRRPP